MVFLTSLNIVDTGYLDVNTRSGQKSAGSDRVNSGAALQLKGVELNLNVSVNLDKSQTPGKLPTDIKHHEIRSLISVNPIAVDITIVLNSNATSTSNPWGVNDMSILAEVMRLPLTPYWKAIYYPVDNTAADTGGNSSRKRNNQMVKLLGKTDTIEAQGDINLELWTGATSAASKNLTNVNYIPVMFENVKLKQLADNKIQVTMSGVVTG